MSSKPLADNIFSDKHQALFCWRMLSSKQRSQSFLKSGLLYHAANTLGRQKCSLFPQRLCLTQRWCAWPNAWVLDLQGYLVRLLAIGVCAVLSTDGEYRTVQILKMQYSRQKNLYFIHICYETSTFESPKQQYNYFSAFISPIFFVFLYSAAALQ